MCDLRIEEDKLLNDWASHVDGFIRDGVVDSRAYLASDVKLLFLLKEVNGGKNWDLREFLKSGGRASTWDNITRWTIGIRRLDENIPWSQIEHINDSCRIEVLRSIAAVNVKKTSGRDTSKDSQIIEAARSDHEMLRKQIDLYAPDIVICGGTSYPYGRYIYGSQPAWETTTRGILYFREASGRIVIDYSHPEARTKDCLLYYGLIDAVKEILA